MSINCVGPCGAPGAAGALMRAGIIGGCAVAQLVIAPQIATLRQRIGPDLEALAASDPLRVAFGRLHGLSVLSLGVAMLFAALTLVAAVLAVRAAPQHD